MKAMIMAAGVGSRLMPLTIDVPKPMIPMGNIPLMENTVHLLKKHACTEIISNLHYHADMINNYFKDGRDIGVSMQYSNEDELMGTAGGVKKCEWFLDDTFVVMSGDALSDVDLTKLWEEHKKRGALATIALKNVEEVEHFGVVVTDENGRIERFQEKPSRGVALSNAANTGIYIFEKEIFRHIPSKQFYDFGKQVFPHLVKIGAPFYGVNINEYWCDIGNLDTYRQAHKDILNNELLYQPEGEIIIIDNQAKILLGKGSKIGENVIFKGQVVIGDNCIIEDNARIDNSVIWNNTIIDKKAYLEDCVIASKCYIGKNSKIQKAAVLASHCNIASGVIVEANSKVFESLDKKMNLEQG